jgi:hypothetical protein
VYRSVATAWPDSLGQRVWRLALIVLLPTLFSDFIGPFNVLHQALRLSVVAAAFWAVSAVAEAFATPAASGGARTRSPITLDQL